MYKVTVEEFVCAAPARLGVLDPAYANLQPQVPLATCSGMFENCGDGFFVGQIRIPDVGENFSNLRFVNQMIADELSQRIVSHRFKILTAVAVDDSARQN